MSCSKISTPGRHGLIAVWSTACLLMASPNAWSALTDISNTPLINTSTASKPNIMLILDDSGSMARDYMPDAAGGVGDIGLKAYQCNGVAYNPSSTYAAPVKADGSYYSNMSLTAAADDGYNLTVTSTSSSSSSMAIGTGSKTFTTGSVTSYAVGDTLLISNGSNTMSGTVTNATTNYTLFIFPVSQTITVNVTSVTGSGTFSSWTIGKPSTVNLASDATKNYYYKYTGSVPALSWTYDSATSSVLTNTTFYSECLTGKNGLTTVLTKTTLTTGSSDAQNYANWYSYYRTRINMMRSATGLAFQSLTSNYRVGFTTISDNSVTPSGTFVDVDDFGSTQKTKFYSDLYSAAPISSTPLRRSLSKVGRYFAKKASGQTYDPMQNSCQRNYAILTTDGYWNDTDADATKLDGTTQVGQQDGFDVRPMYDGSKNIVTDKTTTSYVQRQKVETVKTSLYSLGTKSVVISSSCPFFLQPNQTDSSGTGTETLVQTQTVVNDVTYSVVRTVVTTNGSVTNDTSSTSSSTSQVSNNTATNSDTINWSPTASSGTPYCNIFPPAVGTTYIKGTPSATSAPAVVTIVSTSVPASSTNTTTQTSGGATNTLADVAQYYYKTDLRDSSLSNCTGNGGADVCTNQVPSSGRDTISTQHMTTFTVGLGVSGLVTYDKNYLTQTSGDFYNIANGVGARPDWPAPTADGVTAVDDLWHAAVNGRGQFFSAGDPATLIAALSGVLNGVNQALGTGGAASSSSLIPASGSDQVFQTSYKSMAWTGELQSNITNINSFTGDITYTSSWSVQTQLNSVLPTSRNIYYMKTTGSGASATRTLRGFNYTNLSADGQAGSFDNFCTQAGGVPSQCASLSTAQKAIANAGTNVVNWLRGDRTYEQTNTSNPLFRTREHILGDIIGSSPIYIGSPGFSYGDAGYATYVKNNATRSGMVYVGGNDGMLHAFSADIASGGTGGKEMWAYVPTMVMPNMYKLASSGYPNNHIFMVDATPVAGDVKSSAGVWKSIVVSGLGVGGKGYFALDVSNPTSPLPLWEFTDTDLGLTVGNPVITKRADGTWVVIFSSGYNNTGVGYLYVVDANTGVQLLKIATKDTSGVNVGTAATPSGLGKINAWIDDLTDNTAKRVYGGDMLGNVWRFDLDNVVLPNQASLQLAKLKIASVTAQPITTQMELASVTYNGIKYPVVFLGTGRYLGATDLTDTTMQTIYAIKDPLTNTSWGDIRTDARLVAQAFTTTGSGTSQVRTTSTNAVNWTTGIGWRLDLPTSGERVAFDPVLQYGILGVLSAIPGASTCVASGSSWRYFIDIATGSALSNATGGVAGTYLGNTIAVGLAWVQTSQGPRTITTYSDGKQTIDTPPPPPPKPGSLQRTAWRELLN
ncbi:PilC/PilY family type IV pilus protein [Aquabacterium sp.]|uniref:pilus assembly protein n=1 Tax=Aquabacterium sp. TaxID=1872578 RepID=UPI0019999B90|nr:PilC/PilY family type IV pilus protein [Aquabacterium sp.]MBC7699032.1 pilus assembly protein PilY [Aquabacterium sp.]